MPIVIDANIAIDWFLAKRSAVSERALDATVQYGAIVPTLWRWEVQDVVRRLHAAGKLSRTPQAICEELRNLPIEVVDDIRGLFGAELVVSGRYGLSVYDAAYLDLALRRNLPLATNDQALAKAALVANLPTRASQD